MGCLDSRFSLGMLLCTLSMAVCAGPGYAAPDSDWSAEQVEQANRLRATNLYQDLGLPSAHPIGQGAVPEMPAWFDLAGIDHSRNGAAGTDWPVSFGPDDRIDVRLRAVIVSNDNGSRRTPVMPEEIRLWVDRANEVLAGSAIRILFDPTPDSGDWSELNSTLLNTLGGNNHPQWEEQRTLANSIAAQTPDRMTAFFRWGSNNTPTGAGFSWTDIDFIVMPGFAPTQVCGEQNIGLFVHEVGHYLGLPHTFLWIPGSVEQAESFFILRGHDVNVFDGDGREETAPDPFVAIPNVQCGTDDLSLDNVIFDLPRENAMSYYHPVSAFVNSQSSTMRQTLLLRTGQPLTSDGIVIEPTIATVQATAGDLSEIDTLPFLGRWSNDDLLIWRNGEIGDTLSSTIDLPSAGRYRVSAALTAVHDFAIVEHRFNGQASVPVDLYASFMLCTGQVYLGDFDLEQGPNAFEVEVVGVNPRGEFSTRGYGLDYLVLEQMCIADFTGDSLLDFFDVSAFLLAFNGMETEADINRDGAWDFFDVSAFLSSYAAGCP